ncbi:MAG: YybH family protein [Nitrospiraceae bacterium]
MSARQPHDLHALFVRAFNSGTIDAVMALYEPAATLALQPGKIVHGREAISQALRQFLALKGTMQIETAFVIQGTDLALLRAGWRLAGAGPDGKPIEMQGKNVEVARRQLNGDWLFVIDHPFGAD